MVDEAGRAVPSASATVNGVNWPAIRTVVPVALPASSNDEVWKFGATAPGHYAESLMVTERVVLAGQRTTVKLQLHTLPLKVLSEKDLELVERNPTVLWILHEVRNLCDHSLCFCCGTV